MKIVVTCGPSYEPIDQARRITNFSTGRVGIALANALAAEGWDVVCFKGEQATCGDPLQVPTVRAFSTNQNLADHLERLGREDHIDAIFHAAALCDFRVESVRNEQGSAVTSPKFSTREGRLHLILAPTIKVLPRLRTWFPNGRIVGWKYELAGSPTEASEKAWHQIRENDSDACVLNGAAYGAGYGFCTADRSLKHFADHLALIQGLVRWLKTA
jgi:phosphopantothenoylcysteine decarboxylase/phosphopantothenate--cysteine ligase